MHRGAYLKRGSMEDNALSEPHTLAHGHALPDGDVGAQLWSRASILSPGGAWGLQTQSFLPLGWATTHHGRRGHLSRWVDVNVS